MVKLFLILVMSGALADVLIPAPPPLLIDSAQPAPIISLDVTN